MLWFLFIMFGLFAMMFAFRPFRWGRPFGWRPMPPAMRYRRRMWRRW